jgi:hypothetical protein
VHYALLIYIDPAKYTSFSEEDAKRLTADYWKFDDAIRASKEHIVGEALQGLDTATCVRVRGGETVTTDGPFAETKEVLGGFYIVDVPDLDRAIEVAAEIPDAAVGNGVVEVRPIAVFTRNNAVS